MKNKIIVSLLLVLLIAISASAVSATDEVTDTIAESSSVDLEDPLETVNDNDDNLVSEDTEDIIEEDADEIIEDTENIDKKELGDSGIIVTGNNWDIKTVANLNKYTKKEDGDNCNLLLHNNIFNLTSPVTITAKCSIQGGIFYGENIDNFFFIDSPANGGSSYVLIKDATFYVKNNQNIVLANSKLEGVNNILNVAGITLENITLLGYEDSWTLPSSVTLLNINSSYTRPPSNDINISNCNLNGAKSIKINNESVSNDFIEGTEIINRKNTIIYSTNAIIVATDKATGDVGDYFQILLVDENGVPLANKLVSFGFNGNIYNKTTDGSGVATLSIRLARSSVYTLAVNFNGDDYYYASFNAFTLKIVKKYSILSAKNISYKANATKSLSATFKDEYGHLVKNKKVTFTVNGKSYTATTNSKGVASVKISLNKKGIYTYSVKYAGDNTYDKNTTKAKLTITALPTSLATKKYTFKKAKKTKAIKVTLKSGTRVLKSKKITLKVNGKTYSAKTNSKGVATIKVSLSKKGTYKYTAKFAGDNMYKAISKTNKVVITK